jgi:phage repressor protein C with HTH and peptisase S24 domain
LHGNPRTAERDQRIRTWLRSIGYDVIEIAVNQLDDKPAMTRHFRRLAGYLQDSKARESISQDQSWFERALENLKTVVESALKQVRPRPQDRYVTCVPLVSLKAAAGDFGDPQYVDPDEWEWVEISGRRSPREGMFVAQVVGKSMEPAIPDGSFCLFSHPVTGSRQGRTVLVQLRDGLDPETGERYTVKRYASEKSASEDGGWRHFSVTLRPNNPDFEPIEITCEDEAEVQVIAEFLEVLVPPRV